MTEPVNTIQPMGDNCARAVEYETPSVDIDGVEPTLVIEEVDTGTPVPIVPTNTHVEKFKLIAPHDLRRMEGDFYEQQREHSKTIESQYAQLVDIAVNMQQLMQTLVDETSEHSTLLKRIEKLLKEMAAPVKKP